MSGPKARPAAERLWSRVQKGLDSECWMWPGSVDNRTGYGQIAIIKNGKKGVTRVHRLAYEAQYGLIPAGCDIDHTCHTEDCGKTGTECMHRRCVNPAHLEAVTHRHNMVRDKSTIVGRNAAKTHCPKGHEYNEQNTYYYASGRICKICGGVTGKGQKKDPKTGRFIA